MRKAWAAAAGLSLLAGCASRPRAAAVAGVNATFTRQIENAVDLGEGDLETRELRHRLIADPDDLEARLRLAEHYREVDSPELSIEHYRLASERFPSNVQVAISYAKALRDDNHATVARRVLDKFCARNPAPAPELLSLLGALRDDAGEFAAAEQAYRAALARAPSRAYLHNNLGYNLMLQNRSKEAVSEFEAALAIEPRSQFANNNLGLALVSEWTDDSQPRDALLHWQAVGGPAAAHNNLATVLIKQGRYPEARQELSIALGYDRHHPAVLQNLELLAGLDGKPVVLPSRNSFWHRVTKVFTTSKPTPSRAAPVESASK